MPSHHRLYLRTRRALVKPLQQNEQKANSKFSVCEKTNIWSESRNPPGAMTCFLQESPEYTTRNHHRSSHLHHTTWHPSFSLSLSPLSFSLYLASSPFRKMTHDVTSNSSHRSSLQLLTRIEDFQDALPRFPSLHVAGLSCCEITNGRTFFNQCTGTLASIYDTDAPPGAMTRRIEQNNV